MLGAMKLTGRDIALILVAVLLAAVFSRLGVWQLERRVERIERNGAIPERMALPTLDWTDGRVPPDTTGLVWRRVRLAGRFDREREIVLRGRTFEGRPGVEILTPLLTGEDEAVLVIRGWMPAPDAIRPEIGASWPADWDDDASIAFDGRIVPAAIGRAGAPIEVDMGDRAYLAFAGVDPYVIGTELPYEVGPHVVRMGPDLPHLAGLVQQPAPEPGAGPHLSYAIQWFAFAAISLGGTAILLRKEDGT